MCADFANVSKHIRKYEDKPEERHETKKKKKRKRKKRKINVVNLENTSHPVTIQEITADAWTLCDEEKEETI